MPGLVRMLRENGFTCRKVENGMELLPPYGDPMKAATWVAAMASWAYEGDVRFWKLECGEACDYRIKLRPLG